MPAKTSKSTRTVPWVAGFVPPTPEESLAACAFPEDAIPPEYDARLAGDLFPPLPPPSHIDDWLAQFKEDRETYHKWLQYSKRRLKEPVKAIHIIPVGGFDSSLLHNLREFTAIYYDGLGVELQPPVVIKKEAQGYYAFSTAGHKHKLRHRVAHPYDLERSNFVLKDHVQFQVGPLLSLLTALKSPKAQCLIGVTMYDLYDGNTDSFSVGMAAGGSGVGIFSFCRYRPDFSVFRQPSKKSKASPSASETLILQRSCKTLVHEIAHNFYIGHCVFHQCVMRGSGNLKEDFSIPMHLCPVDLRKFQTICKFDVRARYRKLLSFYEEHHMEDEAAWMKCRLHQLQTCNGSTAASNVVVSAVPVEAKRKRVASIKPSKRQRLV